MVGTRLATKRVVRIPVQPVPKADVAEHENHVGESVGTAIELNE